jgi:hypothetical protein
MQGSLATKVTDFLNTIYKIKTYFHHCVHFCMQEYVWNALRPDSWMKSRQKSTEFASLLFTDTSIALP